MVAYTRAFQIIVGVLTLVLIISLIMNYNAYQKAQRENEYVQGMYNQFIFYLDRAATLLGYQSARINYQRASAETAAAGTELRALTQYEQLANNQTSAVGYPPNSSAIGNFLSFVSLSLINDQPIYEMQDGSKYTVSRQQAKRIILEMNNIVMKNMVNSNIPANKVDTVFNQLFNVIPGFVRNELSFPILNSWNS